MGSTITKYDFFRIPLEDVLKATNNFHDDNIISQGDFGPAYKGQLFWFGELNDITARRLDHKRGLGNNEFWTEVSMLCDLKHENLVSFIGFCDEQDEKIIIIRRETSGSLGQFLNSPNLTWTQRLRISVGVARALSYLRYDKVRSYGVIHRNINTSTILLDENSEVKLSGFEISIKQAISQADQVVLSVPISALGYMDPEFKKTKGVSYKSDIYAFGVVLMEILCGREAFIQKEANKFLAPLAKYHYENETLQDIIHPNLWNQISPQSLIKYSEVAYSCIKEERAHRPDINYILGKLEKILALQLRREDIENNFQHLKIPLTNVLLASDNFSETYRLSTAGDMFDWYRVGWDHFDEEKPSSIKGENKSDLRKKHNKIVIKRFLPTYDNQEECFFTEMEMLSCTKHHNIVTLIGFCIEGTEMIVVSENFSNGYLYEYLRGYKEIHILTWKRCLKICIGVAHALNYLHSQMEDKRVIIHTNISSITIGLDENWEAKIDEFEKAVFLPSNQEDEAQLINRVASFKYYVDPEHKKTGKVKTKTDVYGFGVVLFEILCGRSAYDPIYLKESHEGLAHMARQSFRMGTLKDIIDPMIKERSNKDSLHTFIEIAYKCVGEAQYMRPTMKVVLNELEKSLFFQVS